MRQYIIVLCVICLCFSAILHAADQPKEGMPVPAPIPYQSVLHPADQPKETITIQTPVPYQVVQRQGYTQSKSTIHHPGGPSLGFAMVPVRCACPNDLAACTWEYRALLQEYASGTDMPNWTTLPGTCANGVFQGHARVPAGGWYRLEVRARKGDQVSARNGVEPIGVGEVLLIAGQSYAEGCNEERQRLGDPLGRMTAYDITTHQWRVANDPLPNINSGGTIWPPLGDLLVSILQVPVGIIDVAVGSTSSRKWMPGQDLYKRIATAGREGGPFRFVLWQQGESDVMEGVATDTYVQHLTTIREGLAKEWGYSPTWLPAKSTLHPCAYTNPTGEDAIRTAINRLWHTPGFQPGPDTDVLSGESRAVLAKGGHFTNLGQHQAALLWFAAIWNALQQEPVAVKTP